MWPPPRSQGCQKSRDAWLGGQRGGTPPGEEGQEGSSLGGELWGWGKGETRSPRAQCGSCRAGRTSAESGPGQLTGAVSLTCPQVTAAWRARETLGTGGQGGRPEEPARPAVRCLEGMCRTEWETGVLWSSCLRAGPRRLFWLPRGLQEGEVGPWPAHSDWLREAAKPQAPREVGAEAC